MCFATHRHTDADTPTCSPQRRHHRQTHAESLMHTHPTIPICSIKMQVHSQTQGLMDVQLQALTDVQIWTKTNEIWWGWLSWQLRIVTNVVISLESNSCINKLKLDWDGTGRRVTSQAAVFWARGIKSHVYQGITWPSVLNLENFVVDIAVQNWLIKAHSWGHNMYSHRLHTHTHMHTVLSITNISFLDMLLYYTSSFHVLPFSGLQLVSYRSDRGLLTVGENNAENNVKCS